MRGPVTAMLWALWRLTRVRLSCLAALVLGIGWVLLELAGPQRAVAQPVVVLIAALATAFWSSGTRLLDRAGFPFATDFTRPVPTWLLAGMPLLYVGVVAAAVFALPLLVLGTVFDLAFPLSSGAAYLSAMTLVVVASTWWSRSRAVRLTGQIVAPLALVLLLRSYLGDDVPEMAKWLRFGPRDYVPAMLAAVFAFALTTIGVERQRRGDEGLEALADAAGPPSWWARLVELRRDGSGALLRAPCPTASPARAELWLELKYRGAPVLAVGALIAFAIPLAFRAMHSIPPHLPVVTALASLAIPVLVGVNASMWRGGGAWRMPMSPFEAVRPLGTARLAGLQVLVTTVCALAAGALIGISIWLSLPLFDDVQLVALRRRAAAALVPASAARVPADVALTLIGAATVVALLLSCRRLAERYGKRFGVSCVAAGAYLLLLSLGQALGRVGWVVIEMHLWMAAAAVLLAAALVFSRVVRDRVLTARQIAASLVACAAIAVLYLEYFSHSGILSAETPGVLAALLLSSSLLPLAAVALAPWSLALVRHV